MFLPPQNKAAEALTPSSGGESGQTDGANQSRRQVESHLLHVHHIDPTIHTPSSMRNKALVQVPQLKGRTRPSMRVACLKVLLQETSLKSHQVELLELQHAGLEQKQDGIPARHSVSVTCTQPEMLSSVM